MNTMFAAHLRKIVLVFFYNILAYNQTMDDHIAHLIQVFELLRTNSLTAKRTKCTFAASQVEYLGHIISAKGVATDPTKAKAIRNWSLPKSVTHLRSFLGLMGYYRRFVQDYGIIRMPLHSLLKKDSFH
jgi:hypothetical protein